MPLTSSLVLTRPKRREKRSPRRPHQLTRIPVCMIESASNDGVHSTVWILAIRAALISLACSKISSSDHAG